MKVTGFSVFVFLIFVASCKKDDGFLSIPYPSVYHKSEMTTNGDLRVFSKAGEITDPAIISRFNQTDSSIYSLIADGMINYRGSLDTFQFSNARQARVVDRSISVDCSVEAASKSLLLTAVNIALGGTSGEVFTRKIDYAIGQVKPEVISEFLISSTGGNYVFGYSYKAKYILEKYGDRLAAPFIQYTQHNTPYGFSYNQVNNTLQNDFYKSLPGGDTLTLREYLIIYEK